MESQNEVGAQELEVVVAGYRHYLQVERGLSDATVACYEPRARRFLAQCVGDGLDRLTAAEVSGFIARGCPAGGGPSAQMLVAVVRSVLRYLHVVGLIDVPLEWAVPAAANLRSRALPHGLDSAAVGALLSSCDRRRRIGRRNYAILVLLVRLGLRASEVATLSLEDLRWRAGEIVVHGKGSRVDTLPLPVDVGEALAAYLRSRPAAPDGCRSVFLSATEPPRPISRHTVGVVVRRGCLKAGIPAVGPHQLRHSAATTMLEAGASLDEIGRVLRHRERRTTAIYARVDVTALKTLALPWPAVES
jgi:site-specific recombinase XerD